jgi:hypothetical protein
MPPSLSFCSPPPSSKRLNPSKSPDLPPSSPCNETEPPWVILGRLPYLRSAELHSCPSISTLIPLCGVRRPVTGFRNYDVGIIRRALFCLLYYAQRPRRLPGPCRWTQPTVDETYLEKNCIHTEHTELSSFLTAVFTTPVYVALRCPGCYQTTGGLHRVHANTAPFRRGDLSSHGLDF